MLSIDFTDKQVKIVRGSLNGAKIRVIQVEQRDLPEGAIENGYVTDIPIVASEIAEVLATLDIKDKDTIVCINSGLILYKELILPKQKNLKNTHALEMMIQTSMNISAEYNISYQIIGETEDANNNPMMRVIATACPQRLVDSYLRLFSHLGLTLKSINVSNNCITRLVMHDAKLADLMPLLLVQVDEDFLNINLYDENQLVISRYVKLDKADYNYDNDYIDQAVYENVFHMIQFADGRTGGQRPISEIQFYGNIPDFISMMNAIQSFNIPAHVMSAPSNVVSFCEMDFSEYANAIGAFFRPRKELDHVNLLLSTAAKEKKSIGSYPFILLGSVVASVAIVFAGYMVINGINSSLASQKQAIETEISTELIQRKAALDQKVEEFDQLKFYYDSVDDAKEIFDFMPKIYSEVIKEIEEPMLKDMKIIEDIVINEYMVSVIFTCEDENSPSSYVQALNERGYFENIDYAGFSKNEETEEITFPITMLLKGGNGIEAE